MVKIFTVDNCDLRFYIFCWIFSFCTLSFLEFLSSLAEKLSESKFVDDVRVIFNVLESYKLNKIVQQTNNFDSVSRGYAKIAYLKFYIYFLNCKLDIRCDAK